jgi:hypothetical protein
VAGECHPALDHARAALASRAPRAEPVGSFDNPHLYGLLFRRNLLLRGQEAAPEEGHADTRDPEAGPFAAMMKDIRACVADGSSAATSVLQTAGQLWAAMHGLVLLRGGGYQFPWPDLNQTEMELISSIARFRDAEPA